MPIKTRDPKSLGNADYLSWLKRVLEWLGDHSGDADYPAHLTTGLDAKIVAFENALTAYNSLKELSDEGKSDLFDAAFKVLYEQLRRIQIALPTVAPNPPVLAEFELSDPIPNDKDEIYLLAKNVLARWATVANEPQFAPVKPDFAILQTLYDDYVVKRDAFYDIFNQKQTAQNDVLTTRAACNEQERAIFTWYRSRHRIPTDEWWTETWWGKSSDKEEPGEKLPAPAGLMFDQFRTQFAWQTVATATKYQLEVKNKATQQTTTYETDKLTQKAELPQGDYTAKVRAVREASPTEMSDWSAEIAVGIIFAAPQHLKYIPGQHKFTWDAVAGANTYELVQEGVGESIYLGDATECEFEVQSSAKFRVRAGNDESSEWGEWSDWLAVNV